MKYTSYIHASLHLNPTQLLICWVFVQREIGSSLSFCLNIRLVGSTTPPALSCSQCQCMFLEGIPQKTSSPIMRNASKKSKNCFGICTSYDVSGCSKAIPHNFTTRPVITSVKELLIGNGFYIFSFAEVQKLHSSFACHILPHENVQGCTKSVS